MPLRTVKPEVLSDAAFNNIQNCRWVPASRKRAYLKLIAGAGNDRTVAENLHNAARRKRIRQGPPPAKLLPTEGLGVLVREEAFVALAAKHFEMDPFEARAKLDAWLRYEAARALGQAVSETDRLDATAFLRARLPTRDDGEAWFFRSGNKRRDAFDGEDLTWLPQRLGLIILPGETRLALSFQANLIEEICQPTYFDVPWRYLDYWYWDGHTRPIAGTPPLAAGLEEVVAAPPFIRFVNATVRQLKTS